MTVKVAESKARVGREQRKGRGCSPRWPKATQRGKGWHSPSQQVPGENRWCLESHRVVQVGELSAAGSTPGGVGLLPRLTPTSRLPSSDGSVLQNISQPPTSRALEEWDSCPEADPSFGAARF